MAWSFSYRIRDASEEITQKRHDVVAIATIALRFTQGRALDQTRQPQGFAPNSSRPGGRLAARLPPRGVRRPSHRVSPDDRPDVAVPVRHGHLLVLGGPAAARAARHHVEEQLRAPNHTSHEPFCTTYYNRVCGDTRSFPNHVVPGVCQPRPTRGADWAAAANRRRTLRRAGEPTVHGRANRSD